MARIGGWLNDINNYKRVVNCDIGDLIRLIKAFKRE